MSKLLKKIMISVLAIGVLFSPSLAFAQESLSVKETQNTNYSKETVWALNENERSNISFDQNTGIMTETYEVYMQPGKNTIQIPSNTRTARSYKDGTILLDTWNIGASETMYGNYMALEIMAEPYEGQSWSPTIALMGTSSGKFFQKSYPCDSQYHKTDYISIYDGEAVWLEYYSNGPVWVSMKLYSWY